VSAEEREEFISSEAPKAFRLGREFSKRPQVVPPRHPSPWLLVDAIPDGVAASLITAALAAAAEAGRANPPLRPTLLWVMAVFLAGIALTLAGRRFIRDREGARRN